MLIKSHPEANPDEQPYHGRFLFVTTGQAEELLNYHSAPIAQRRLSYILTFAACFFFPFRTICAQDLKLFQLHSKSKYLKFQPCQDHQKHRGGEEKKKKRRKTKKQMLYFSSTLHF